MRTKGTSTREPRELTSGADDMPVTEISHTLFKQIGEGTLDNRKRLGLTKVVDMLQELFGSTVQAERLVFTIHFNKDGQILLVPETTIPLREAWLHRNPGALKSVLTGLAQAEKGELQDLGSFGSHADDTLE